MKHFLDVKSDDREHHISLSKLASLKVKDVVGYTSKKFGSPALFKINRIILEDGTQLAVNGEHDIAYIEDDIPGITDDDLNRLYQEEEESYQS